MNENLIYFSYISRQPLKILQIQYLVTSLNLRHCIILANDMENNQYLREFLNPYDQKYVISTFKLHLALHKILQNAAKTWNFQIDVYMMFHYTIPSEKPI